MSAPVNSTKVVKTVTIGPGETFVLPSNSTIKGVVSEGGGSAQSPCPLPPPLARNCYTWKWQVDEDSQPEYAISVIISGTEYQVNTEITPGVTSFTGQAVVNAINNQKELKGLMKAFFMGTAGTKHQIAVAVPDTLGVPELRVFDGMSTEGFDYYIKGVDNTDCVECQNYTQS